VSLLKLLTYANIKKFIIIKMNNNKNQRAGAGAGKGKGKHLEDFGSGHQQKKQGANNQ
jgi:hypothetical protein